MKARIPVDGDRIRLREWRADEADALHRWLGDPDVTRFLSWGSKSLADSERHLAEILEAQTASPREKYWLAVELRATGVPIGDAGFTWLDGRRAEIGYFLEPAFQGRGLGTEVARLVIDLAFSLGAEAVQAGCDSRNLRSERVMQRCGLRRSESGHSTRTLYRLDRAAR